MPDHLHLKDRWVSSETQWLVIRKEVSLYQVAMQHPITESAYVKMAL